MRSSRSRATYGRCVFCGQRAPVIPRDVGDDGRLLVRESEDLRGREDVLRVLVVRAQADVDPDVVEQRGDLQEQALRVRRGRARPAARRTAARRDGDMAAVVAVEAIALAERLGAGEHLTAELLRARAAAQIGDVEQHAGAERGVADDQPAGGGFATQCAVDEQRRRQRLGLGRGQPEALDQIVFFELRDIVAERQKAVARDFPWPAIRVGVEYLRAAKRTSPPMATKWVMRSSGIRRRISSMMFAM